MGIKLSRISCSTSSLRICLAIDSVFLWIEGLVFTQFGVLIHNLLKNIFTNSEGLEEAGSFPTVSIILGTVFLLTALLVNFLILHSSKLRYFSITFVLIVIFLFELIYSVTGYHYAQTFEKVLKNGYRRAMANFREGFVTDKELNFLQSLLNCCGFKHFMDWYHTSWAHGRMQVPESCCKDLKKCHNLEPLMVDDIHQKGCSEKIESTVRSHNTVLSFAVVLSVVTQFIGIVLSTVLGIRELQKTPTASERAII